MLSVSVFFNVTSLPDSIYEYTKDSLEHMVKEGAFPDLIQVGNEIINGMLWPVAKVDPLGMENWDLFVKLLESGAKACREICPKAKIIIHTALVVSRLNQRLKARLHQRTNSTAQHGLLATEVCLGPCPERRL